MNDIYFEVINYLSNTDEPHHVILKRLEDFLNIPISHEELALINKNNSKKFWNAEIAKISVLEFAAKRKIISLLEFEDLYKIIYTNYVVKSK